MTYWMLNAIFLAAVAVVALLAARRVRWAAIGLTAAVVLAMTAVFDNIMIAVGLVAYNESLISGAFIGIAPLEDFAYAIAAIIGLPSLWVLLRPRSAPSPVERSRDQPVPPVERSRDLPVPPVERSRDPKPDPHA